ncbi:type II toxin-antitoxin system RelE/ParE family toxin [Geoalkalibacter halelectricus]|uniref:Type II toxin-antitoxin system RelE/ParE family toxin n=1 Tax=Geoalkalibacter halelectricus TaxID=2847045 RepID=A0ABY5ZHL4_9BACT|nr:type II toxin-antitoxin system RelE/ParE family toxin [Geoalkalibacter halelectricus]MDO3377759.1 type II toxin-antitoxin system RelE/ParE family toxin [Geoalkalibacter halelectricus]UWZ78647.1 type II toxin-antitoxin system RelE/ParE family toxin [Geoalkalibacter halelectricus]
MRIQWTEGAERNLDAIAAYIAEDNPAAAAATVLRILRRVAAQLSAFPASGKPGRIPETRELVFPELPYIVVYTVVDEVVTILRVFHAARKID